MRPTCYNCARKHLAQADILMMEAAMGYPIHAWYAMGHMAEAADELVDECPAYANYIREERKMYEDSINAIEDSDVTGEEAPKLVQLNIHGMIADITLLAAGEPEHAVLKMQHEEIDPSAETTEIERGATAGGAVNVEETK